jgi:hypothetical protein
MIKFFKRVELLIDSLIMAMAIIGCSYIGILVIYLIIGGF